jgi:transaldolase
MVTTLALYEGKTFSEFELVGLTTNPEIIATVVELIQQAEAHALPSAKPATRRRGKYLRVVKQE